MLEDSTLLLLLLFLYLVGDQLDDAPRVGGSPRRTVVTTCRHMTGFSQRWVVGGAPVV